MSAKIESLPLEILENILLHLPPRSLLQNQRVCKCFRNAIARSDVLQRALFFSPISGDCVGYDDVQRVSYLCQKQSDASPLHHVVCPVFSNPLLEPLVQASKSVHSENLLKPLLVRPPLSPAWAYAEASWRRMYVSQPLLRRQTSSIVALHGKTKRRIHNRHETPDPTTAGETVAALERLRAASRLDGHMVWYDFLPCQREAAQVRWEIEMLARCISRAQEVRDHDKISRKKELLRYSNCFGPLQRPRQRKDSLKPTVDLLEASGMIAVLSQRACSIAFEDGVGKDLPDRLLREKLHSPEYEAFVA